MLFLLFHIDDSLYAIDTDSMIEIVSMVILSRVQSAPDYVAGMLNYHGAMVPTINLCRLLQGTSCPPCYSTRILVMRDRDAMAHPPRSPQSPRLFGLLAERVTETLRVAPDAEMTASMSRSPYMGDLLLTEKGLVQTIHWERLLADTLLTLPVGEKDWGNGAGLH
jgi:chemotaxis-related protein WspB